MQRNVCLCVHRWHQGPGISAPLQLALVRLQAVEFPSQSEAPTSISSSSDMLKSLSTQSTNMSAHIFNNPADHCTLPNDHSSCCSLNAEAMLASLRKEDLSAIEERPLLEDWLRRSGPGWPDSAAEWDSRREETSVIKSESTPAALLSAPSMATYQSYTQHHLKTNSSACEGSQRAYTLPGSPVLCPIPDEKVAAISSAQHGEPREDCTWRQVKPISCSFGGRLHACKFCHNASAVATALAAPIQKLRFMRSRKIVPV